MANVQAPIIPIIGRWIAESPGTLSLGQGMVAWGPPPEALEALSRFGSKPDDHRYGPVEGLPELVEALEAKLCAENGITVRPASRVIVTAGANMAFMDAVLAVTDPGDEVILQAPFYFNHEMAIVMAGCRPVVVPTDARYQLRPDAIGAAVTSRTRAIVTISPNNPTGAVYPEPALRAVNALCRDRGLYHLHDEVYEYFTYDGAQHFSPGSLEGAPDHTISLFSLSKAYGFASWRIGYMVIPARLFSSINKIQDTMLICPPALSQQAALAALGVGAVYCRERVGLLDRARRQVLNGLAPLGDSCTVPAADGAFYVLLRLRTRLDAVAATERLIRDYGVAVVPGTAFGLHDACYLRVSYGALDEPSTIEALERLIKGLEGIMGE